MKKLLFVASLVCGACSLAWPQSTQGYFFFAPGQFRAIGNSVFGMHFGGGGKYIARNGAGFGGELGIVGPKDGFSEVYAGLASANAYYVFRRGAKAEPYLTGGYSRTFGHHSGMNWGNFGVGLTYWAGKHAGLMLEFRDHLTRQQGVNFQFWAARLGLAIRSGE